MGTVVDTSPSAVTGMIHTPNTPHLTPAQAAASLPAPIAMTGLLPTPQEYKILLELASTFIETGFLPNAIKSPAQALTIMLTGRELNLPPMLSLRMIHVIDGKPGLASELQLARFRQAGGRYRWTEKSDRVATIQVVAPGNPKDWAETFSFTIEEAESAGLLGKANWKKYPAAMLRARAASLAIRAVAPEVSMGLYDPDELGAVTNEDGEVEEWPTPTPVTTRAPRAETKVDVDEKDPVLPLDRLLEKKIPLSSMECHVGLVLAFVEVATKDTATAKKYASLVQRCWGILPEKVNLATPDQLQKTLNWLDIKPERALQFSEWGDAIVARLEHLTRKDIAEKPKEYVHDGTGRDDHPANDVGPVVLPAADSNPDELFDETGPGGTLEVADSSEMYPPNEVSG